MIVVIGLALSLVGLVFVAIVAIAVAEKGRTAIMVGVAFVLVGLLLSGLASVRLMSIEREVLNGEVYEQVPLKGEVVVIQQIRIIFKNGVQTKMEYVSGSIDSEKIIEKK